MIDNTEALDAGEDEGALDEPWPPTLGTTDDEAALNDSRALSLGAVGMAAWSATLAECTAEED